MPMQRYSDQQVPVNSKIHNSLRRPNPPILESVGYLARIPFSGSIGKLPFFCRGGFSHANATLFGSASSSKQQDSQQLEATKPAHSENIYYLPIKPFSDGEAPVGWVMSSLNQFAGCWRSALLEDFVCHNNLTQHSFSHRFCALSNKVRRW